MKIRQILQKSVVLSFLICLIAKLVQGGQILGERIIVDYDYDGNAQQITLLVQFESTLTANEIIQIQFPTNLGPYNQVTSSIYQQNNNLLLAANVQADATSTTNYYIFAYAADLKSNEIYRIEVNFINQILSNQVYNDPISMITASTIGANSIVYDQNLSLFYLYIAPTIPNETLIVGIQLDSKPQEEYITDPGIIFSAFIDITPSLSNTQGGYYYIYIDVGPNVIGSQQEPDFMFVGNCYSVENKCDSSQSDPNCQEIKQVKSTCRINNQSGMIELLQSEPIVAQNPIRVKVEIQNCLYTSQRDIKVYSASINDQRPMEKGRKAIALRVSEVQIIRQKIQFLWGIDENESIYSPFKLFQSTQASPLAGPINSIQVYFSIPTIVPEGSQLTVSLETGATGALEHSIITNLPIQTGQTKVSCYFDAGFIRCKNIGAFLDVSIQYFIAAKIFYSNTATNPTNFAGIKIDSIILDSKGLPLNNIYLFQQALGKIVTLQANTEYLDTAQWHNTNTWSFGTTQIVSAPDDGTLSGTPNGINTILKGTQNTVGIVPDLDSDQQQLLFFLKVTPAQFGSADNRYYRMSVLYNPSVVKYNTGFESYGIDFAAFTNSKGKWELDTFKCYNFALATAKQCVWYNKPQSALTQANRIDFTYNSLISNPYAFIRFECGSKSGGVAMSTCNNFQGYGTADSQAGAFSMRNVYFDSGFQSSIYPDDKLLDFIITFEDKLYTDADSVYSTVTTQLINAYTIQNYRLSNIKVSYVNLYSQTGAVKNNDGLYLPTMLRIGGSILRSESFQLDKIHIFLDQNVDATDFLENQTDKSDHSIGCSQATCEYFANAGASIPTDTWFNQKKIEITNLPNIQNEFNILIPIKNLASQLPSRVVIAFTNSKHSTFGMDGLDQVLNVFRISGLPVNGQLQAPILTINGIANNVGQITSFATTPNNWKEVSTDNFNYKLDITNVGVQGISQAQLQGDTTTKLTFLQPTDPKMYGAGLTISSFTQNIFSISDIQFKVAPSGAQKCTNFAYKLNSATVPQRNGQYNYVVFCPIDDNTYKVGADITDPLDATKSGSNVIINDPNFPGFFVNGYDLSTVLSYGFSNNKGNLIGYSKEAQTVTVTVVPAPGVNIGQPWQCNTNTIISSPHANSKGRQKIEFSIPWNDSDIKIDSQSLNGYPSLNFKITFTPGLSGINFIGQIVNTVDCTISQYICTGISDATSLTFTLAPVDANTIYTIERSQNIVITAFAQIATPAATTYKIDILIPTKKGGSNVVYGDTYNAIIYQQCIDQPFVIAADKYDEVLQINNLIFEIINFTARGTFSFDFKSVSARQEFYITSQYIFTLGYLQSADNQQLLITNDFRCQIMQSDATLPNSPFTVSHLWKMLLINQFTTITLTPQDSFDNPQNYQFKLICIGGSTPDDAQKLVNLVGTWQDGTDQLQVTDATSNPNQSWPTLALNGFVLLPKLAFATKPVIVSRLFASPGMEAHYKFKIQITTPLTVQSRIYIDFGIGFSPRINKHGRVECYITNSAQFDTQIDQPTLTLCEIINSRRLKIYANDLVSSIFYIDVFGVSMPRKLPVLSVTNPIHWIGVDDDDDLSNGIVEQDSINDTFPSIRTFQSMTFSNVYINQNIIRRAHSIVFTIQTERVNVLNTNTFYIDFPYQYDSIIIGDTTIKCSFRRLDLTTYPSSAKSYITNPNLIKKCDFISLTRMRIILLTSDDQTLNGTKETYSILVSNIISPSQAVTGLRFNIFASMNSDLNSIFLIASDYGASDIAYVAETEKTDLYWSSIQYQAAQQQVVKTTQDYLYSYFNTVQYFNVYIGFYNADIQLYPQSSSPTVTEKFENTFNFSFIKYTSIFYFGSSTTSLITAQTGTSMSQFKIGAQSKTSPGIYTLHPTKGDGDTLQQYMDLPPLNIVVSTNKCVVNVVNDIVYQIPVDGQSLPIIFDFTNCYPTDSISYTPTNDLLDPTTLIVDTSSNYNFIDGTSGDLSNSRMSMSFKPSVPNLIPVNTNIVLTFTLGGYNVLSYIEPNPVKLQIVDNTAFMNKPVASNIVIIKQVSNTIQFQFSCDQPSVVLYQVGLEGIPTPVYTDIVTKLTSSKDFYNDLSDFQYYNQYGRLSIQTVGGTGQTQISGLQSSQTYNIYYFCVNQRQLVSDPKKSVFTIISNSGYLLKIILYFSDMITYFQNQDIACALNQVFQLSYNRVVNEQNVYCGGSYPYYITDLTANFKKTISTDLQYTYQYYILPDKTLSSDLVNLQIKEIIQQRTFNETLLSRTQYPQLFPILIDIETEDVLSQLNPVVNLSVTQKETNYAKVSVTLVGQKGYIYIGILSGGQVINFKNFLELKKYQNLLYFWSSQLTSDIEQTVTFTNLQPGTTYTLFYAATNDNPSIQALSTSVQSLQFQTKSIQIVVDVSSKRLFFSVLLLIAFILL